MKTSIKKFIDENAKVAPQSNEIMPKLEGKEKCVVWEDVLYVLPESNPNWTEEDKDKYNFLTECFLVE